MLSARERQILDLLARGSSNLEIANELTVSSNTVKYYLREIFRKLEVCNRTAAVVQYSQMIVEDQVQGAPDQPRKSAGARPVTARGIRAVDLPFLMEWFGDPAAPHLWNVDRSILTFRGFLTRMDRQRASSEILILADVGSGRPVGYSQTYLYRPWASSLCFTMYLVKAARYTSSSRAAVEVSIDVIKELFPIHTLYSDVYPFSSYLLTTLTEAGFVEEATTPEHYWFDDEIWPRVRLSLPIHAPRAQAASKLRITREASLPRVRYAD